MARFGTGALEPFRALPLGTTPASSPREMLLRTQCFILLAFASLGLGCASETASSGSSSPSSPASNNEEPAPSTLASCSLPTPCSWPVSSGLPDDADGARCVISELSAGRALSVDTRLVADGPPTGCEVHQELYFFAEKGVAYDVWRKRCGTTEESKTKRCTMLDKDAYATCLSDFDGPRTETGGIKCSLTSEWMKDCAEVDAPVCP